MPVRSVSLKEGRIDEGARPAQLLPNPTDQLPHRNGSIKCRSPPQGRLAPVANWGKIGSRAYLAQHATGGALLCDTQLIFGCLSSCVVVFHC